MSDHYFAREPAAPRRSIEITADIRGRRYTFASDAGVFSADRVDPGTLRLAETMEVGRGDRVLDLGCGYGVLGIVAAALAPRGRAVLVDRNQRAAELAQANIARHNLPNARVVLAEGTGALAADAFDLVVTNPPVHAGNRAVFAFIEGAQGVLRPGGWFYLVGRRRRGALAFSRHMQEVFGSVEEVDKQAGYRVYRSRREV